MLMFVIRLYDANVCFHSVFSVILLKFVPLQWIAESYIVISVSFSHTTTTQCKSTASIVEEVALLALHLNRRRNGVCILLKIFNGLFLFDVYGACIS